jgi:N-acetylmuramoyl-L-alanine amidase
MRLYEKLLTINQYSRSGRRLADCKAVILHYVGIPGQRAQAVWNFFENDCPRNRHYSSAHYIVDLNGDVYRAVPDNEVAYHCGSQTVDKVSGRVYTDWARGKFGRFVSDPNNNSPNNCTVGIEMCIDAQGNFTSETVNAAVELVAKMVKNYHLTIGDIGHHNLVVGWKDCPLPWVRNPELFDFFIDRVKQEIRDK